VNTANVVLKTRGMPEWRKLFEAEDVDFGAIHRGQVCLERRETAASEDEVARGFEFEQELFVLRGRGVL
jgi:hypothetical protein